MAISIGYHASHEQFAPSHLLQLVQQAQAAGFDAIHSSDHFHPWSSNQGHSGFSFSWIGAAMQATTLPFSMVCAPGQRYHPAIVAQAIATLAEMFPGRFTVELGSGEALNERMTGQPWPPKEQRNQRLLECVHIIRQLLSGEEVTFKGLVEVQEARLYTLPAVPPPLFCAAITIDTAAWAANWADGLLTTCGTAEQLHEKYTVFNSTPPRKPVYVQYAFSYAATRQAALDAAMHQWKSTILPLDKLENLYKPEHFDAAAAHVQPAELEEKIALVTSMEEVFEKIHWLQSLSIDRVVLHNINRNHEEFINDFGKYRSLVSGH